MTRQFAALIAISLVALAAAPTQARIVTNGPDASGAVPAVQQSKEPKTAAQPALAFFDTGHTTNGTDANGRASAATERSGMWAISGVILPRRDEAPVADRSPAPRDDAGAQRIAGIIVQQ